MAIDQLIWVVPFMLFKVILVLICPFITECLHNLTTPVNPKGSYYYG
jgi:hypothetical protein